VYVVNKRVGVINKKHTKWFQVNTQKEVVWKSQINKYMLLASIHVYLLKASLLTEMEKHGLEIVAS